MKGISTVIATLLMLVITLGLIGLAYGYISGIFMARTAIVLTIDEATTVCDATGNITVGLKNDGTASINLTTIELSGTKPDRTAMTKIYCNTTDTKTLLAGGTAICFNSLIGSIGTNTIRASGGGSTAVGYVSCIAP